ncbi:MAG: hypothetical protein FJX74_02240 [Armatimonadetes bacterium]|nr:hypothetical protein [Armatimonadota bacterium]
MDTALCIAALAALCLVSAPAHALEARVEVVDGVPTLLVNGEPMPPFIVLHTAGAGAQPKACPVRAEWQPFSFTFRAPQDDDLVGLQIRNIAPIGDWFVDDARFFEGTLQRPRSEDLLQGGDFEGDVLPPAWNYFLNSSTGAAAEYSLSKDEPRAGRSCLRVAISSPGTIEYEVHLYQTVAVRAGRTYTFSVWLRSPEARKIEIQAVHQGPPWTVYGGENAASDKLLALGAARGLHIGTVPIDLPWPGEDRPADYGAAEAQVEHILAIDPDALIIPRIQLDAPDWWKAAHPGHRQVYDGGERPMPSPASQPWRTDVSQALRAFLRHLESRFGDHMLGYHIGAQSAGEWFYDHTWEPIMPGFEEPFREAFARWAQERYGTEQALREAWGKPELTFETIRVPTVEERTFGGLGAFRDPGSQRFEIDFAGYMQVCLCEFLEACARLVKEETGGRKLSVFFYGYLYDVSGFAYGPAVSGHLRLRRALDCPDLDLVCSPISYFDRGAGGVGPFMAPVDSIQAHGKLWVNEDDARTHLAPESAGYGRTADMRETLGVYRRNFGRQFERRCATWWMDFGTGWMADETIFDGFARARDIWQAAGPPLPHRPQVAVITDEESGLYLRNSNEVTAPSVSWMRRELNTMGCPIGLYLMDDVCEGNVPDSVRLYVFLNAYRVTGEQRQRLLREVARDGKTVLWLYAPGYIREDASAANVSDLLGFRVDQLAQPTTSRVTLLDSPPAPLGRLSVGHTFGADFCPTPLFSVSPGQTDVVALGCYEGTPEIGMAMRRSNPWTSVFCGGLQVSAEVLRELARAAGAHIYCESNDVISGCPGFVAIHATAAGEKTLTFPQPVRLRDLLTDATLPAAERHTFPLDTGDTRLFAWDLE